MIINKNFKKIWSLKRARKKNIISKTKVDKRGNFPAYLLFAKIFNLTYKTGRFYE